VVKEIIVTIKSNYGTEVAYPVCEHAKLFARIAGTKTLTIDTIDSIKDMGIGIVVEHQSRLANALGARA
jgi:hypothetical protein